MKRKLKFQDYKSCLKACQIENKINHLEKNKIDIDSLKEDEKEFIKIITNIKTQQGFKSERNDFFTKEINKIALSSNDGKRMQSIDSIETYEYGMNKNLVCKKKEIKCNNIKNNTKMF